MANNGVVISVPINIASDVYSVLGLSGPPFDIGYACKNEHGKINKWSRYKPYSKKGVAPISIKTDPTRMDGQVWGMFPPKQNNNEVFFNQMAKKIMDGDSEYKNWEYNPPTGGPNSPYRITDFIGYNHAAQQVFSTGITNYTSIINLFDTDTINFYLMLNQNSDFTMSEFVDTFLEYRFVVEVYIDNTSTPWYQMSKPTYRFISENTIKEMKGWSENIQLNLHTQLNPSLLENRTIHTTLGIQNIQNGTPESGTGIFAPWDGYFWSFYKILKFENYFSRTFIPDEYAFSIVTPTWYQVYDYPILTFIGTRDLIFKFRIERKERKMYIAPERSEGIPTDGYSMKIKAIAYGSPYKTEQYAQILSNSLKVVNYTIVESTTEEGAFQDVYLLFDNLLQIGTLNDLDLQGTIDNGATWIRLDSIGMNVTCK